MEIYNELIFDLLADRNKFKIDTLNICEDQIKGFYVKNLSQYEVSTMEEIMAFIEKGESNRHYAATAMNHHSSRSHTIFRLHVSITTTISTQDVVQRLQEAGELLDCDDESCNEIITDSVLSFIDLAGSERVGQLSEMSNPFETTCSEGAKKAAAQVKFKRGTGKGNQVDTLQYEGRHINTSLFYLQQVITMLSEKKTKSDFIPYRNSSLTKLLRSSLGGNAKTCIICTATPTYDQFEMTLSTLRFGGTASTITNEVAANILSDKNAEMLAAYQRDIDDLRLELEAAR